MRRHLSIVAGGAAVALFVTLLAVNVADDDDRRPASVHHLPAGVAGDCSRPVEAEISGFIASVPNGSTIVLGSNACYGHDGELVVSDREGLTIDGNGSTFRPLTPRPGECRVSWRIQAGRDIHLKNIVVRGRNTTGYDGPRQPIPEGQCHSAFSFDSVQGGSLTDSKAFDSVADPVSLQPDRRAHGDYCAVPPNRDIRIDRFEARNAGRTVGVTNVDGLVIRNSYFGDMYDNAIDIETDVGCEWSRNIKILGNRFGRSHFGMLTYTGGEPPERSGGLEVIGNVVEADPENCNVPITVAPYQYAPRQVRQGVVIRDNELKTRFHGISLVKVGSSTVEGNVVTKNFGTECGPDAYVVTLRDSHGVAVSGNRGIGGELGGFGGELAVDALSTAISGTGPTGSLPPPAP